MPVFNLPPIYKSFNMHKYMVPDIYIYISELVRNEPTRIRKVVDYLAKNGWYYSLVSSWRYFKIAEETMNGNDVESLDEKYCEYYSSIMESKIEEISSCFPQRKLILDDSYDAHRNKKYSLSILGYISQCDGIFKELTNSEKLFSSHEKEREKIGILLREKYTNDDRNEITSAFLFPLNNVYPHNKSGDNKPVYNRNGIMHGEITNYATELNSLKSFSFLVFVSELKSVISNKNK